MYLYQCHAAHEVFSFILLLINVLSLLSTFAWRAVRSKTFISIETTLQFEKFLIYLGGILVYILRNLLRRLKLIATFEIDIMLTFRIR